METIRSPEKAGNNSNTAIQYCSCSQSPFLPSKAIVLGNSRTSSNEIGYKWSDGIQAYLQPARVKSTEDQLDSEECLVAPDNTVFVLNKQSS